jgi:hypothetical protein
MTDVTGTPRAAGLTDGDVLRGLLGRYCDLVDAGDYDGVGELFAEAQLVDLEGRLVARGATEATALFAGQVQQHDGSPRTKHLVLNSQIEIDGDVAVVRSSYLVLQQVPDVLPLQPIVTGRYVDTFARRDPGADPGAAPGWVWTERRFGVDLVGDLSHHFQL